MKKILIALMLATSACSANSFLQSAPVIGHVCTLANGTLVDDKVVFASETLYNIPADAFKRAVKAGKLPQGTLRANLRAKLMQLDDLRNAVFHAKGSVNCDFEAMKALHADILSLIPRN